MTAFDRNLSLELEVRDVVRKLTLRESDGSRLLLKNFHDGYIEEETKEREGVSPECELKRIVWPVVFHLDYEQLSYVLSQIMRSPPTPASRSPEEPRIHIFKMIQSHPQKYFMDPKANEILTMMQVEKRELEHSLNWLSTLGGAFSALGENSISFAHRAGNVSKGQLLIAVKLGSPQIMSRCRLYAAISLIQLGKLKVARKILIREYNYAKSLPPDSDPRLKRMCIGIWAKLKYEWKLKRRQKGSASHG